MLLLRRQILRQLEADGILHDNKTLPLPRTTSRIAIVSAEGAAGYGDFCDQLLHNEYGLRFTVRLFPAVMQGQNGTKVLFGSGMTSNVGWGSTWRKA